MNCSICNEEMDFKKGVYRCRNAYTKDDKRKYHGGITLCGCGRRMISEVVRKVTAPFSVTNYKCPHCHYKI